MQNELQNINFLLDVVVLQSDITLHEKPFTDESLIIWLQTFFSEVFSIRMCKSQASLTYF